MDYDRVRNEINKLVSYIDMCGPNWTEVRKRIIGLQEILDELEEIDKKTKI